MESILPTGCDGCNILMPGETGWGKNGIPVAERAAL